MSRDERARAAFDAWSTLAPRDPQPYRDYARLLMEAGVVTSLHSDDNEISTRMNWEAGKLLRSGVNEIDVAHGLFPTVLAGDPGRGEVEGLVGDAGVEVDAAVVVSGVDVVVEVADLRVLAEHRVVVGRPGRRHVAQPARRHPGQEEPLPDQPVGLGGRLGEQPLL